MNNTLLEVTQLILSALDSDEVNSYDDTTESLQVATLLQQCFYDCATELGLPQQLKLVEITETTSSTPTLMSVPTTVSKINWIRYDNKETGDTYTNYQPVDYMPFQEFLDKQTSLRGQTSNVGTMNVSSNSETFEILFETNRFPTHYTTMDDSQIIFDAYNSDEETFLKKIKTMCEGWVIPAVTLTNNFEFPLEPAQLSYFINKAKTRAFAELKQTNNQESASEARRQKIILQKRKRILPEHAAILNAPRYGRG